MEQSVHRIAQSLATIHRSHVVLYSRHDSFIGSGDGRIHYVSLKEERDAICEPLGRPANQSYQDTSRVDILLLSRHIKAFQAKYDSCRHIIISFYASSAGFVAQHVASNLNLPHIATIRGTDFQDLYDRHRSSSVAYVINDATWVVTTNREQEAKIRKDFHRVSRLLTIYNSLPDVPQLLWRPRRADILHLVADSGYSFKKATHLLIKAVAQLKIDGFPVTLSIVGNTDRDQEDYWQSLRSEYVHQYPEAFTFRDRLPIASIPDFLLTGDAYCSFSLSEGCSSASLRAMTLGMPIVASRTGALEDIGKDYRNLFLFEPGDVQQFRDSLKTLVDRTKAGDLDVCLNSVNSVKQIASPLREWAQWEDILTDVLPKQQTVVKKAQKRILFFIHDGSGLGHLKRLSRVAKALQGDCACLIVSGHRAASWIVPEECEFIHLPSLDSLLPKKADYWGRKPFLRVDKGEALHFRKQLLDAIVKSYAPDAVVVDFLPLGKYEELDEIISNYPALKYFILRGVLDRPDNVPIGVFRKKDEFALEEKYSRILVAGDTRVIDVAAEYSFSHKISAKITYVGYVSDPITPDIRASVRLERGLSKDDKWVVCSAGGGVYGERFIEECARIIPKSPNIYFDVVTGPKTSLKWTTSIIVSNGKARYLRETPSLASMHAAADVVVCHGGYNSLVESLEGSAHIICHPIQLDKCDEQYIHPMKLSQHLPITINTQLSELERAIEAALAEAPREFGLGRRLLNFNGIETIRDILFEDLGLHRRPIPLS